MMIKAVFFDFDGVFTDGNFLFTEDGISSKSYNCKDSYALKMLKENNILTGVITRDIIVSIENAKHIFDRLDKVSFGETIPKIDVLKRFLDELNLGLNEVAYMGDDLDDMEVLKSVKLSGCPYDAVKDVQNICSFKSTCKGGQGAVREFVEYILKLNNETKLYQHIKKNGKITAVIPARSGSTRCKNKNIRQFNDSNLLRDKILALKKVDEIDEILVSSNCDEVLEIAKNLGVSIHKRDEYHASSDCSGSEVYKNLAENITNEFTLYTHCVCPYTSVEQYKNAIYQLRNISSKYDSIVSYNTMKHFLWNSQGPINYSLNKTPTSQELEELYIPNFSICLRKTEEIIREKSIIGFKPLMLFSDAITGIDIDHNYEFITAELLGQKSIYNENDANKIMKRRNYTNDKMLMLDCTIRDGGYLNNWNFTYEEVIDTYKTVSESNYDYFEIGFRVDYDKNPNKGRWCYSSEEDINIIKNSYPNGCKIALMCIVGQNDVSTFPSKLESNVDMIRVLMLRGKDCTNDSLFFSDQSILDAKNDCIILLNKGYQVAVNVGCGDIISDYEINLIAKHFSDLSNQLEYLYIADTYGGFTSKNLPVVIKKFQDAFDKYNMNNSIKFGFHIHNNRGDGLQKLETAKYLGVSICDSSICGLGRGAGNLIMEEYMIENLHTLFSEQQLLNVMNLGLKYSIVKGESNYLSKILYSLAGKLSLHPDYISDILNMNLSIEKSYQLLLKIDKNTKLRNKHHYDDNLIKSLK